jgi:cytochrome b involved in lipid metabolism
MIRGKKFEGKPYSKRNYYVIEEVRQHNIITSAWITLNNLVYDITNLLTENHSNPVTNSF